jgi:hypothetical protein
MQSSPQQCLPQIVVAVGRNPLASAKQALLQYLHQFVALMEKLLPLFQ